LKESSYTLSSRTERKFSLVALRWQIAQDRAYNEAPDKIGATQINSVEKPGADWFAL
jgi:hypothetical protein